ncbi:Protein MALE DISCOVERER 2 [Linum grandiflorum]
MLLRIAEVPSSPESFPPSFPPSESPFSPSLSPSSSPISAPSFPPSPSPTESPSLSPATVPSSPSDPPNIAFVRPQDRQAPGSSSNGGRKHHHRSALIAGIAGGSLFIMLSVIGLAFLRSNKVVVTVRPWATGLSGQLQRAFVTGVPKLKRLELQAACEDFSNIIGSFVDGTVYKGTLSSGVEIAVTSVAVSSKKDWSKNMEARFRKKIATLSRVNHKNFVNLIGFCEEDEPFTRMMVFEYAPNGTLFEHLHIKEAEHLEWGVRLRIAMGMAYCLEHTHQLTPPIYHDTLRSSSVYLTEDYAAKISDFYLWNDVTASKLGPEATTIEIVESPPADAGSNVYNFGMVLLELITGRIPYTSDDGSLADWASDHLRSDQPLGKMVDPTLKAFQQVELEKLVDVIRYCIHPDPKTRPSMRDVAERLREITSMDPDRATPRLSPLWWAELEIMSTDGC